jgi:pimeloyl-ACP methyl ester carboxylesterase
LRFQRYVLLTALVLLWVFAYPSSSIASPVSQTFDANGVKLHYLIEGTGEPVVLIHGLDSSARINWQMPGTIDAIARDHQVIALDLPGFGHPTSRSKRRRMACSGSKT